jgi:hypothetical protein
MTKYLLTVRADTWHYFEIEAESPEDAEKAFYELSPEKEKAALIETETFTWDIEEIEERKVTPCALIGK